MYNLTISVVNGQLMRTINRSLRVHPLVAIAANPENPPVMADDSAATELEIEVMLVSNETASPKLQTLMQDNTTNEPVIAVSDAAPSAAEATVTMSSEPAASRIANMVNQLKAKVAFGGKTTPEAVAVVPEKTLEANTNSNTSDTPAGQDATRPSYWIWLAVGAAVLVLLLLWVILRRSSKLAR
jgi:hypothetical protein